MAYAHVKNILNIPNEDGSIDEFIKISSLEEFNLYEFLMKLQLLKNENFFQIDTCIGLEDIMNANEEQINVDILSLIEDYSYLGDITYSIDTDSILGNITINVDIKLNDKIYNMENISTSIDIYNSRI